MGAAGPRQDAGIGGLHSAIRRAGMATLVTHDTSGMHARRVRVWLDEEVAPFGALYGYLPRTAPEARPFGPPLDAVLVFHGPEGSGGDVSIHAQGRLCLYDDSERLNAVLGRLANRARQGAWPAGDDLIAYGGAIGFELLIASLDGPAVSRHSEPAPLPPVRSTGSHAARRL